MRKLFYVERKKSFLCKNGESNKGKYGKIKNRTACKKRQLRCENKMVSSDTEYTYMYYTYMYMSL